MVRCVFEFRVDCLPGQRSHAQESPEATDELVDNDDEKDRQPESTHVGVALVPLRRLLVGMADPAQHRLGQPAARELDAVRQTVR